MRAKMSGETKISYVVEFLIIAYFLYNSVDNGLNGEWLKTSLSILGIVVTVAFFSFIRYLISII